MNPLARYGVVGRGKTGSKIIQSLGTRAAAVFSKANPISFDAVQVLDALIVFVPANALQEILPQLLECRKPVVCGTTGFEWPAQFHDELASHKLTWIVGSNFSPGMNFIFAMSRLANANREFLGQPEFKVHEIHHVHKLDSPSGTACTLKNLVDGRAEITAERVGDHPGFHELSLRGRFESLSLQHSAIDRTAFANGAIYAADSLLATLKPGLHSFENLMFQQIMNNAKNQELT